MGRAAKEVMGDDVPWGKGMSVKIKPSYLWKENASYLWMGSPPSHGKKRVIGEKDSGSIRGG
jgi:hypothetical protein